MAVEVDSYVQSQIMGSNGLMYRSLRGKLASYPIPELPLPAGNGRRFLDVGCSWGRWSISAARKGYRVVGIDASEEAIKAARRVAQQLGVEAEYRIADARQLPFDKDSFDVVFSYSFVQHFHKTDAGRILSEMSRVLAPGGESLVEMPNSRGVRNFYQQLRRGFREGRGFEVRYWGVPELKREFERRIGPSKIKADGFFSLNPQKSDIGILPFRYRPVVGLSEFLKSASRVIRPLAFLADSVYVQSLKKAEK